MPRSAADPRDREAAGLKMDATLRLMATDMTGGSHVLAIAWNGSGLGAQTLEGERSYIIDWPIPSAAITCGDNALRLSVESADPDVFSEIRIDDVEVIVTYDIGCCIPGRRFDD